MKETRMNFLPRVLVSLILAFLIWFSVNGNSGNIITRTVMNIPVSLTNEKTLAEKGLIIENKSIYYVNLQIRGTENSLDQINAEDLSAEINLSEITGTGNQSLPVVIKGLNNTVILDQTIPETIELDVNEITAATFTPVILTQGKPADGYSVISATTSEAVMVGGSQEQVDQISTISGTASVDGLSADSYQLVELHAYNQEGDLLSEIEITPNVVESSIQIGVTKQVAVNIPSVNNAPANGYKVVGVEVSPKSVKIAGMVDVIDQTNSLEVNPISITEPNSDRAFTQESDILIPDGVSIIGAGDVASVTVDIEKINQKNFNLTVLDTVGLGSGLVVERINPGSVTVTLSGTSSELSSINNAEVKGILDVTGLGAGKFTVPVQVNIGGVSITSINPQSVEVTLTAQQQN